MTAANLGTKRQCPKCAAKFYDFGADDPIACPKCGKTWSVAADKKARKAAAKSKKEPAPVKKKVIVPPIVDEDPFALAGDLPEVEGAEGDIEELEPMEDESVELTSLEEVEEHEEEKEADPNSDDADDDMFTEIAGEDKLVDDLEQYIETDEDEEDDEDEEE